LFASSFSDTQLETKPPMTTSHDAFGSPAEPDVEPAPPETEELEKEDTGGGTDDPWFVVLFNDEVHTFEEVIGQLVKATGCSRGKAEDLAWTVHNEGKATVYEGSFEECFDVQSVLKEIQLVTEIQG
jgi:ATP-dependent Clp protease adapter protein ClpS